MTEQEIRTLFQTHGVSLGQKDVWHVQGQPVIKHSALERIAVAINVQWLKVDVIRNERDEAVICVHGKRGDKDYVEFSFGEAVIGMNYKVSGKQAAYPWAMAEKRAKDRVIIKLADLHGAYSSEDTFELDEPAQVNKSAPLRAGAEMAGGEASNRAVSPSAASADPFGLPPLEEKGDRSIANTLISALKQSKTDAELTDWFRKNKATIRGLPGPLQDEIVHAGTVHRSALQYAEETA